MLKYISVLLLGLVLGCNTAYAQNTPPDPSNLPSVGDGPIALITGPNEVLLGRSAWFKTLGSYGNDFQWKIIPQEAKDDFMALPIYGGQDKNGQPIVHQWGCFSSSKPGIYYFVLVATKDNKSVVAIHKLVNGDGIPGPGPGPGPSPQPNPIEIPTPSAGIQKVVGNVTKLITGPKAYVDGKELAMFYMDLADVVKRDSSSQTIKDTTSFRTLHVRAGKLMFQDTGMDGRYQNLGKEVDQILEKQIGLEIVSLNGQKRSDIVEVLEALAWASLEASKKAKK